jgi:membrane associated rhomboid family serine protease
LDAARQQACKARRTKAAHTLRRSCSASASTLIMPPAGARAAQPYSTRALLHLASLAAARGEARSAQLLRSLAEQTARLPSQPHATLLIALALTAIHFRELLMPELEAALPHARTLTAFCVHPSVLLRGREWWRLLAAPLLHVNDTHLYYNIGSFFVNGAQLEPRLGFC